MNKNKLIIAAAGSGKTTFLVKEALRREGSVLITTYTQANEEEIRKKIIEINRFIPANITIQTWFSFLLQHGVRPYQGVLFPKSINGMVLVNEQSAYWFTNKQGVKIHYAEEKDFVKHYFTKSQKLYSDKIAKFVIRCNEKSNENVMIRLAKIYSHIFIDEVQDLAGYDLEVIKLLFATRSGIVLVGDPRQVTYLTHPDKLHAGYQDGRIEQFILEKCKKLKCDIDSTSLNVSHRNIAEICSFSSRLYPQYPASVPCTCESCRAYVSAHNGIFVVRKSDLENYKATYIPVVLRYTGAADNEWTYGKSKGLGFDRVLIHPTETIIQYLKKGALTKNVKGKVAEAFDIAKFYVAVTRARHSVGIVYEYTDEEILIEGIQKFIIAGRDP